jgi:drug/metabolite transporter (DMT)-like permease
MEGEVLAVTLALASALSWGFSAVLVRKGLAEMPTTTGTHVSLLAGLVFTAALVLIFERDELTSLSASAILTFALIGTLNFPLGRFFNYMSIGRLGVGRSTPILASAPLFAMILAVVFTGEELSLATLAGTALILSGLYVTLRAPARPRTEDANVQR